MDYVHVVLRYGPLRAILHAGSLVRAPGPRFEVHGDRGSFVKDGMDGQIAAMLAGGRPGDPGWGVEPEARQAAFYREMAAAVRDEGPVPVPAEQARDVVRVIECAMGSSRDGRVVAFS